MTNNKKNFDNEAMELNIKELDAVSGGGLKDTGGYGVYDEQGNLIATFSTLSQAQTFLKIQYTHICSYCKKDLNGKTAKEIYDHLMNEHKTEFK